MALVAAVALVVVRVVGQDAFYLGWNGREKFGKNSSFSFAFLRQRVRVSLKALRTTSDSEVIGGVV